jgi:hypothetical protein
LPRRRGEATDGRRGGLDPGVSAADNDNIEFFHIDNTRIKKLELQKNLCYYDRHE